MTRLDRREATLRQRFGRPPFDAGRAAVAFSGGVDSALVLAVARETLGEGATAITAVSASFPRRELEACRALAKELGARHELVATDEVRDPRYAENSEARCYWCKVVTYDALAEVADRLDLGPLVDGMNRDDTADHRPGRRAAEELGVVSPLFEAGLGKDEVRALARRRGLEVWDKPAMACLSSRIPYGVVVTEARLAQVEAAEDALAGMGLRQVRVRHFGSAAVVELGHEDLAAGLGRSAEVEAAVRRAGYRSVAIDPKGYRRGSLNGRGRPDPGPSG